MSRFHEGDLVQTPFGKGVLREVRNNGRALVDVGGRAMQFELRDLAAIDQAHARKHHPRSLPAQEPIADSRAIQSTMDATREVDLHGLTVEEALTRAEAALDAAMRADAGELRLIHGQSGGRIRAALHKRLKAISSVRGFRLDPRNPGVTIVSL